MVKGWLRVGIYFTFLLGIINMVMTIVRFVKLYGGRNEGELSLVTIRTSLIVSALAITNSNPDFWNSLDLYIGLVIACLPSLRPYFNLAAESRAFSYVKGKTSSRVSGYTGSASTQSSGGVTFPSKAAVGPFVTPADRLSQPSLHDMNILSSNV